MFGSVVQLSETELRIYYLVDGQSAGLANCVAVSTDGATWTKPSLGLIEWGARANRTSSKSNNSECCGNGWTPSLLLYRPRHLSSAASPC